MQHTKICNIHTNISKSFEGIIVKKKEIFKRNLKGKVVILSAYLARRCLKLPLTTSPLGPLYI